MYDMKALYEAYSVEEAVKLRLEHPEAQIIAGGTDVLIKLREFKGFSRLVDIHGLPELKPIVREADGTVRVGSGASFTDLEESPIIRECIPMLGESAASVAGPQIRNMGTIGGNLCNGAVSADTCAPAASCAAFNCAFTAQNASRYSSSVPAVCFTRSSRELPTPASWPAASESPPRASPDSLRNSACTVPRRFSASMLAFPANRP